MSDDGPIAELLGREAGGVRIDAYLGQGGSGPVYRGTRLEDGAKVVVKIFDIFAMLPPDVRAQFVFRLKEDVATARSVAHPCLVEVYAAGEIDDMPYVVSEFVRGTRLDVLMHEQDTWTEAEALDLVRRLAGAVRAAHHAGLVHGDVKPGNVIVLDDGTPALTDLGHAKYDNRISALTRTGRTPGAPLYQAPEQARDESIEPAADIFGLGATLLALLTPGAQTAADRSRMLKRDVSPGVRDFIVTAMAPDPRNRQATAERVMEALDHLISESQAPAPGRAPVPSAGQATVSIDAPEASDAPWAGDEDDDDIEVLPDDIIVAEGVPPLGETDETPTILDDALSTLPAVDDALSTLPAVEDDAPVAADGTETILDMVDKTEPKAAPKTSKAGKKTGKTGKKRKTGKVAGPAAPDQAETIVEPKPAPKQPKTSKTGKRDKPFKGEPKRAKTGKTAKTAQTAKPGGGGKLVAVAAVLLLLAGGAFAGWWFGLRDPGPGPYAAVAKAVDAALKEAKSAKGEQLPPAIATLETLLERKDPALIEKDVSRVNKGLESARTRVAAWEREQQADGAYVAAEKLESDGDLAGALAAFQAVVSDFEGTEAAKRAGKRITAIERRQALDAAVAEARAALGEWRTGDARAALDRAAAIDAEAEAVVALTGDVAAAEEADAAVQTVEGHLAAKEFDAAKAALAAVPEAHPKHAALAAAVAAGSGRGAALVAAAAHADARRWTEAREALAGLDPADAEVARLLARITAGAQLDAALDTVRAHLDGGRLDEARTALEPLPADDERVQTLRAELDAALAAKAAAAAAAEAAAKAAAEAVAALARAESLVRDGRFSEAGRAVKTAEAVPGDDAQKKLSAIRRDLDRGRQLYRDAQQSAYAGRNREAESHLSSLQRIAPGHAGAKTLAEQIRDLPDGLRDGGSDDGRRLLVNVADEGELVRLDGGSHQQGDAEGEASEAPGPAVELSPFLMDRYEVTNRRYAAFLSWQQGADDPHAHCHPDEPEGKDHTPQWWNDAAWAESDLPVVGVDWYDAYAYAKWAGLSLPTEAQWEAAARGTDGRVYPWGNEADPDRANSAERLLDVDNTPASDWARLMKELADGQSLTTYPGSYPQGRSPSGAYDMAGNVWEWCLDTYRPDAYAVRGTSDPAIEGEGWRVLRGGSWYVPLRHLRAANRWRLPAAGGDAATGLLARRRDVGFRCVRNLR